MPAVLELEGETLKLSLRGLGGDAFGEALAKAKSIPGRRFEPSDKTWRWPADPMTANRIVHALHPEVRGELHEWVKDGLQAQADEVTSRLEDVPVELLAHDRARDLFPHQRGAVDFIARHPATLVADDMGLGKTIEAIIGVEEFYLRHTDADPMAPRLVVAPASMAGRWVEELRAWSHMPVTLIPGRLPAKRRYAALEEAAGGCGWVVVTWEQIRAQKTRLTVEEARRLRRKFEWRMKAPVFADTAWGAVIADEAHRAKNRHAQQTRGLWQLRAPIRLALTGTPILNSPDELWPLLVWLRPESYGEFSRGKVGWQAFFDQYVDYYEGHFGKIITGVKNADALRFELADKLVRRTKGEVLDLPEKIRTRIPVDLLPKQRKLYDDAEAGLFFELQTALGAALEQPDDPQNAKIIAAAKAGDLKRLSILVPNAAARTTRLRQIASTPALLDAPDDSAKLDAAVEMISDHPDRQFVVFTAFQGTVAALAARLTKRHIECITLTGSTPQEERTDMVNAFQAGEKRVFVCTIGAGGVGLTLTAADAAIFLERDWTPANNEQAEDRLHRIGQTSTVNVYIFEAVDTIDDTNVASKNRLKDLIVSTVIPKDSVRET